jgi:hypothetical protein
MGSSVSILNVVTGSIAPYKGCMSVSVPIWEVQVVMRPLILDACWATLVGLALPLFTSESPLCAGLLEADVRLSWRLVFQWMHGGWHHTIHGLPDGRL